MLRPLLLWLCLLGAQASACADVLELRDLRLIDGSGAPARKVQRLLVRDGRIVAIDAEGTPPAPAAGEPWTRLDLAGANVMPGLIDTHVHVARFPDTRAQAERILRQAVQGGVTAVRDLAGDARALAELQRGLGAGEWLGPHLVYSALIGGGDIFRDGPTAQMSTGMQPGSAPWARRIDATTDLRLALAEARGTGATNLKLYGDVAPDLARAVLGEAARQGLSTTAHATVFPARPSDLVEAGVGSLAHAPYLVWEAVDEVPADYRKRTAGPWATVAPDHPRLLALYRRMAARGTSLDATLYVYKAMKNYSPEVKADWTDAAFAWAVQATRIAHAHGVSVTTGTDWFEPREGELPHTHEELALLVDQAGFSPMQAIVAATRNGAIALGIEAQTGTIAVGKSADLLVLEADPLRDIRHTQRIRMTFRGGRRVDPAR